MNCISIKNIEGCLEGTNVKDITWDCEVRIDFVNYLRQLGKAIINEGSGKPFYKIIVAGQYSIKGIIGANTSRIILASNYTQDSIDKLIEFAADFKES